MEKDIGKINKGEYQGTVTDIVVGIREYNERVGVDIALIHHCNGKADQMPSAIFYLDSSEEGHVAYLDVGVKGIPNGMIDYVDTNFQSFSHPELGRLRCYQEL